MSIVHQWGSGDEVIGSFWDIPRFGVILLGPVKLIGLGFFGYLWVVKPPKGDFFYLPRVLMPSLL